MNDTNVFLSYKLQTQKLKEKWSTKGTRLDGIEKIAMSFTLQISSIWSTETFFNPLVWRVRRPRKETQCFLHVQGLTKQRTLQNLGQMWKMEKPMGCNFIMKHQLKELTKLMGKRAEHIKMTLGTHRVKYFALFSILGKGEDKNWSPKLKQRTSENQSGACLHL